MCTKGIVLFSLSHWMRQSIFCVTGRGIYSFHISELMPPPTFFIWIFSTRGNWSKPIWESKKHTRPPWKWKTSDLGHFRLKMTQKCITFEQKLQFTKFKALKWSEFHQKIEFPSTIPILGELMPPSNLTLWKQYIPLVTGCIWRSKKNIFESPKNWLTQQNSFMA